MDNFSKSRAGRPLAGTVAISGAEEFRAGPVMAAAFCLRQKRKK